MLLHLNTPSIYFLISHVYCCFLKTKIVAERWGNAGWTTIPFIPMVKNACSVYLKNFKNVWTNILGEMGVKKPQECPVPPVKLLIIIRYFIKYHYF